MGIVGVWHSIVTAPPLAVPFQKVFDDLITVKQSKNMRQKLFCNLCEPSLKCFCMYARISRCGLRCSSDTIILDNNVALGGN